MKTTDFSFPNTVEFLYGDLRKKKDYNRTRPHCHDCWQIEISLEGTLRVKLKDTVVPLEGGEGIFIPPGEIHDFDYGESERYATIKFQPGIPDGIFPCSKIDDSPQSRYFLSLLTEQLREKNPASEELISYLLADLFACHFRALEEEAPRILRMIDKFIALRHGTIVRVSDLAEFTSYHKDYLNRMVRKACGIPLKQYLDRELAKRARRLLNYSSRSISEIAVELGFPSVYAFSRFFSRMNQHCSPMTYRKSRQSGKTRFHP